VNKNQILPKGGLGVQKLLKFNCALLEKWLWLYGHERERHGGLRIWQLVG